MAAFVALRSILSSATSKRARHLGGIGAFALEHLDALGRLTLAEVAPGFALLRETRRRRERGVRDADAGGEDE